MAPSRPSGPLTVRHHAAMVDTTGQTRVAPAREAATPPRNPLPTAFGTDRTGIAHRGVSGEPAISPPSER